MRTVPTIEQCMTPQPLTVQATQPIREAYELLAGHGVRHLPVLRGERLVGLLSQRDLYRLEGTVPVDRATDPVSDAMTLHPFTVAPGALLSDVVRAMARDRIGAALVEDGGRVVGLFTTTDALRVFSKFLDEGRLHV